LDYYFDTGSDFFQNCDRVFIAYGGEPPHRQPNNSHLIKLKTPDEIETMKIIKEYASNNIDDKICYIHTKGVTKDNECITEWRNYMFYFCCEMYKDRLENLNTFDTCGVDLRNTPVNHYSGNFWWATAKHINSLCEPQNTFSPLSERHKSEFWICSGGGKHHSVHDCGINVYERHLHHYPRERYVK
jgi:hypothetical protein